MAWLQKRGSVWWLGWRHDGKQFRRSTGESRREEAERQLAKIEILEVARRAKALTGDYFALVTGRTMERFRLDAFLRKWLDEAQPNVEKRTFLKYQQVVRELLKSTEAAETGLLLEDVTSEHISRFIAQKRLRSSLSTVKGFRRILSSIFIQAENLGYIRGNPVAVVKVAGRKDEVVNERRPFTLAEVRDLHARADPFWQYMIMAGFFTGQSLGDLITLKRANVDLAENVLRLTRRKTKQRVTVPLTKELRELMIRIMPQENEAFFWPQQAAQYLRCGATSFSQSFYDLLAEAGLVVAREDNRSRGKGRNVKRSSAGLGFHNLRHTFVTMLKMTGAVDSIAKELAGHRSSAVNTHYTHLPVDTLAKAVDSLPTFASPPPANGIQDQKEN